MKKSNPKPRSKLVNSRKAIRKEKRQLKKAHRKEHYLKKKIEPSSTPGKFVKRVIDSSASDGKVKKKIPTPMIHDILNKERKKEIKETERLKSQMENQRKKMLLKANEDEEKVIKKLEKQLGLQKSKNKNNYFADDGLDYLLEICDRSTSEQIVAAEKHLADVENDSDFEDDLAMVTGKELKKDEKKKGLSKTSTEDSAHSESDDMAVDDESEDEIKISSKTNKENISNSDEESLGSDENDDNMESDDIESDISDEEMGSSDEESDNDTGRKNTEISKNKVTTVKGKVKVISEEDITKVFSDDEISHLSGGDSEMEDNIVKDDGKSEEKPEIWEDIYGRKRDKEGNIIKEEKGVYIPPHLRNKDSGSEKELAQLKRQVKSVLNKLSGTNLHWASMSIENLYLSNSRNSVNTALTQLWLDATVSVAITPDRMVAEHAALVSVLHANVGSEIGAHFLEELSKKFDLMMMDQQPVEDKRLDNLVSCLAHLYSFKIYQANLLYDILARLVEELSEKSVDCVLTALRCVGGVLRKEEPLALKSFIHEAQAKLAQVAHEASAGSRIKFLLEVLLAVKNNNLTKIPNYEPTYVEHLKKMCRAIVRKGNYATPLNIRLEDLLRAHERGKWWVVGSAWEGNRPREETKTVSNFDEKLLKLAREQRMNTDVRRSIFCVIMSAQDFMDAFEKLQHLGLKGQQEREIVHVLLACCLQEKKYNPYYSVLGQKLCDTDRKYQLSIQYSVWDKIKELDSLPKQSVSNLAQFLTHLIMEKGLPLSVLKIIEFSDLNKYSVKFMRQILLAIIMNDDLQAALDTFHRIAKPPKLHMFRESLRLFIQHFLIKNAGKKSSVLSDDEMATLKARSVEVDKILTAYENKLRL